MHVKGEVFNGILNLGLAGRQAFGSCAGGWRGPGWSCDAEPYFLNSLHDASAAIFHGDLGRASAATEGVFSFNALHGTHAAIFHGDLGRACAATEGEYFFNALHGTLNSSSLVADRCDCGCLQDA